VPRRTRPTDTRGGPAPKGSGAPLTRRRFLVTTSGALAGIGLARAGHAQGEQPLAGQGANGTLRDPSVAGRSRTPTSTRDNDEAIKQIEQRLHCTCGCNLDVFTCRTTDFSCTYSPELHREVVALYDDGKTAQQILDTFVAKYGEKVLMAPEPGGFNLLGYLLPGVAITIGAAVLALVIGRRERRRSLALATAASASQARGAAPSASGATPEELDRLRQALDEVED
jgi:cytochrome c-type biogenesis protein CcmH/NrfF